MTKKALWLAAVISLGFGAEAPLGVEAQSGYRASQSGTAASVEAPAPAHPGPRALAQKWRQHKAQLGRRLSKDRCVGGGRLARFEHGVVFWSPEHGAHALFGALAEAWLAQGGASGGLGHPISDEYAVGADRRSDFQYGYVVWSSANGTTVSAMHERCVRCADGRTACGTEDLCTAH